jgi:hypothetical protein
MYLTGFPRACVQQMDYRLLPQKMNDVPPFGGNDGVSLPFARRCDHPRVSEFRKHGLNEQG